VVRAIFGATKPDAGEITINGKRHNPESPQDGINMGVGFLPEDRKLQGLALKLSVQDNINLVVYPQIAKLGIIDGAEKKNRALRYIDELRIRTPSMVQRVDRLSGGNQQKVVVSKWLNAESEIFIFDEPTTGVDVGAKMEIYKIFEALTARGASIILISSYLPEVLGLADRILVMHEGNLAGIVGNDATEEEIMRLASGLDRKGTKEERV
jgi:ribose transport system ATP-binding protein